MLGVRLRDTVFVLALLALAAIGTGAWADDAESEASRFATRADLVQVDVVVVDAQGRPVEGLSAADFELQEDGVPHAIEMVNAISAAQIPPPAVPTGQRLWMNTEGDGSGRSTVLVFDDLGLTPGEAEQARRAARDFLDRLQPGDSLGLASASGRLWCTGRMPEDREGLLAALQRVSGMRSQQALSADQMTEYEAARIVKYGDALVLKRVEGRIQSSVAPTSVIASSDASSGISEAAGSNSGEGRPGGGGVDPWMLRASAGSVSSERQMAQSLAAQVHARANERRGQLLQMLARVVGSLSITEGRKTVVLLSARYLDDHDDPRYAIIQERARRATVVLYAIDVRGLSGEAGGLGETARGELRLSLDERAALREGLANLASEGGGFAITSSNDLSAGLQRISSDARQYYLLGYRPQNTVTDGKYRRISVSVHRPGVSVRARPGRFATGEKAVRQAGGDDLLQLRHALDSPSELGGIPLRLAPYFYEHTRDGATRTQLVTELRVDGLSFEKRGELFSADVDVMMAITHYASGKTFGGKPVPARITTRGDVRGQIAWYRLAQELELPPGVCQARLVVRDRKNGNLGSVIASFKTPAKDGPQRTLLVLSDVATPAVRGQPPHAVPQARRSFPASGTLYSEFEVFNATADRTTHVPRLSAGFAIQRKGGKTVRETEMTPLEPTREHRFSRLVAVSLGGLKAGDYQFVLRLEDEVSGEAKELREPFTLVRPAQATPAVYQDIVQEYTAGRAVEALGELFAWRTRDIAELVRELDATDSALVHSAAMLHTEAVLTLRAQGQAAAGTHLEVARELLARAEPGSTFRRDWLLAVGASLQAGHSDEQALEIYTECLEAFPSTPTAWLASGTVYEFAAFPNGLRGGGLPGGTADLAKEAERRYRQALALDPTLAEAHLRLGHILMRTDRPQRALIELRRATQESAEAGVKALAHLFLGDLTERLGSAEEALAHYRAALEQDPALQQAGLAESALLERRGGRAAALSALEGVLRGGCAAGLPRWLGYHLGFGARADTMVQELRRRVRS